jgi:phage shock protein E
MHFIVFLVLLAFVILLFAIFKRSGKISSSSAQSYLKSGALLVDVRSPGEFNSGHLPDALNLPFQDIEAPLPPRFEDLNQVMLLHCRSGMRSMVAAKKLQRMGYTRAYNLGSYSRAAHLVNAR